VSLQSRNRRVRAAIAALALSAFAWTLARSGHAAPADVMRGAGPADPPPSFRGAAPPLTGPSIVKGQPAGIDVGQCPPDFKLQPIEPYADLKQWLGDKAPTGAEDMVMLSDFVGKAPILLLFGSYT